MAEINALVPANDLQELRRFIDEEFDLEIMAHSGDEPVQIPKHQVHNGSAYARFLYNPSLLDVFARNLKLPIQPIKWVYKSTKMPPLIAAWQSILNYLDINPGFFTYRFGVEEGLAVKQSLTDLIHLGEWVQESGYALTLEPIHRYRNANTGAQVVERGGIFPKSM
jgi:hypothetical protein